MPSESSDREIPRRCRGKLKRTLSGHRDNVARFNIVSMDDSFSIEFTENASGERYWNIASYPPRSPPDHFEEVNSGKAFYLLESEAASVGDAERELAELLDHIGGEDAWIDSTKTFHCPETPEWVLDTTGWLKSKLSAVIGRGD